MSVQDDLRRNYVVGVNEYPSGLFNVGHVNVTFLDHGIERGTYGYNSQGIDLAGRQHKPQVIWDTKKHQLQMLGGTFPSESHAHALTHYVIVSSKNYFSMQAYALSRAQLTTIRPQGYGLLTNNCADFVYRMFAHSGLPEGIGTSIAT